ncbi:MAG: hypothetical protein K2X45_19275 [Phreatobacter sp.]|nr:hypothetical protein [Phreatobacter sp.]
MANTSAVTAAATANLAGMPMIDGFTADPQLALQEAYILNLAQAAAKADKVVTGELLADYVDGTLSFDEVVEELKDLASED